MDRYHSRVASASENPHLYDLRVQDVASAFRRLRFDNLNFVRYQLTVCAEKAPNLELCKTIKSMAKMTSKKRSCSKFT